LTLISQRVGRAVAHVELDDERRRGVSVEIDLHLVPAGLLAATAGSAELPPYSAVYFDIETEEVLTSD